MNGPDVSPPPPDPADDEALVRRLCAEAPLPLPPGLVERVLLGLPPRTARPAARRLGPLAAAARVAAAVLVATVTWLAATGAVPTEAVADPAPALGALAPATDLFAASPVADAVPDLPDLPDLPGAPPALLATLGAGALALGLALAPRALGRRSSP